MIRGLLGLGALLAASIAPLSASGEEISRCLIAVHEAIFLDGPCNFESEPDGSFTLGVAGSGQKASRYFAYVFVEGDTATGHWNGFPPGDRAHDPLGEMTRDGACWVNETARVCAFR